MKLLIHDLNQSEWNKVAADYEGWTVISDDGSISPCVGCFGCWIKDPGVCVIKDGYEKMGALFHKAEEVVIMSRYTYGGFSSFVKNVMDRSIGYILPLFEIYKGEMHHKKRYDESKPITFIIRGEGLTEEDKEKARKYIQAVVINFHGEIKDIRFEECTGESAETATTAAPAELKDKTLFLNCSLRGDNANSKRFLDTLSEKVTGEKESVNLLSYMKKLDELVEIILSAKKVVIGMPLYVDGIPSAPLRLFEKLEKAGMNSEQKVYLVTNMGFYESKQLVNLFSMVKTWCEKCGVQYCGGVGAGAGEMMGYVLQYGANGPAKNIVEGINKLGETIETSGKLDDIYADATKFPRIAYLFAGSSGMKKSAKANGLKTKDIYRRIEI